MPEPRDSRGSRAGTALDREAIARLRRLGGDGLTSTLAALFLELAPRRLEAVRAGLSARDADAVRRAAHSLKSSAGNIGATAMLEEAGRLEAAAETGEDEGVLRSLLDALEAAFAEALPELEALSVGERRGGG